MAILSKNTTIGGKKPLTVDTQFTNVTPLIQLYLNGDVDLNNVTNPGSYIINNVTSINNFPDIYFTDVINSSGVNLVVLSTTNELRIQMIFSNDFKFKRYSLNLTDWSEWEDCNDLVGEFTDLSKTAEIFNDYEHNEATGQYSHAEGKNTLAGYKGYKILSAEECTFNNEKGIEIVLRDNNLDEKAFDYYKVGDKINYDANKHFSEIASIKNISQNNDGNTIIIVDYFSDYALKNSNSETENWINVNGKRFGEIIVQFYAAHAEGENTITAARSGHAEGRDTKVVGNHGHAEGKGTKAGYAAHAEGQNTIALNDSAHAEGGSTRAYGKSSHAEGSNTEAIGISAHSEGGATKASGDYSHTEGLDTKATNTASHSEGNKTTASGMFSHSEGSTTTASAPNSHAEGDQTISEGYASHAEGGSTRASGEAAHAEGGVTIASGRMAHSEGHDTKASGEYSHAEGQVTEATHSAAHAEGQNTKAINRCAHAEGGNGTTASGVFSHAEGDNNVASGNYGSHAEGQNNIASGKSSHAEGQSNEAIATSCHAEGKENIAGKRAFYIEAIKVSYGLETITLEQCEDIASLNIGDVVSLAVPHYNNLASWKEVQNIGAISDINENIITVEVDGNSGLLPEHLLDTYEGLSSSELRIERKLWINDKPQLGNYEFSFRAHAEGKRTKATGDSSHTEGNKTIVHGPYGHAEGNGTLVESESGHAEGRGTTVEKNAGGGHAEGQSTRVVAHAGHAEGTNGIAYGHSSHAEGTSSIANGQSSHAEGEGTAAIEKNSHAEGYSTRAEGVNSHSEGESTIATGEDSHAEGKTTQSIGKYSHSEGEGTVAQGDWSHAEGRNTQAIGADSHAEGTSTQATGNNSHAEGGSTKATGANAHSEGASTQATGSASHAEGTGTKATARESHAEGAYSEATGNFSHAEGERSYAQGAHSHAGGILSKAVGENSFAHGYKAYAQGANSIALGILPEGDYSGQLLLNVGNGKVVDGSDNRSSALKLDYNGNLTIQGNLSATNVYSKDDVDSIIVNKYNELSLTIDDKLSNVYKYKGTIDNYEDLPTNSQIGDVYNIKNAFTYAECAKFITIENCYDAGGAYECVIVDGVSLNPSEYDRGAIYDSTTKDYICDFVNLRDGTFMSFIQLTPGTSYYMQFPESPEFNTDVMKSISINAGDNAAWNGSEWDILAGIVEMPKVRAATQLELNAAIDKIMQQ